MNFTTQTQNRHFAYHETPPSLAIYHTNATAFHTKSFFGITYVNGKALHIKLSWR